MLIRSNGNIIFVVMYTVNTTFITDVNNEANLSGYLNSDIVPYLNLSAYQGKNSLIRKVIEISGNKPDPENGVSIALSVDFASLEEAKKWKKEIMEPLLKKFQLHFGDDAFSFDTILDTFIIP